MANYIVKLINRLHVAEGTIACLFAKPENFTYRPGQYISLTLINPKETDSSGNTRFFSLASAPDEQELMIATRMRDSAFKRMLEKMPLGTEVELKGPYGHFTLHENLDIPAAYITGGIGITPVRSIVQHAATSKMDHPPLFLFYANHRPEEAAFLPEFINLMRENSSFHFIGTMTQLENSEEEWEGDQGYIDEEMLLKYLGDLSIPIYYISGPKTLVAAIRKILKEAGVADTNIRTEEFSGY